MCSTLTSNEASQPARSLPSNGGVGMETADAWNSALHECWQGEGREWLPASEETARLHVASLLSAGKMRAASMQRYLSANDNYHEAMGIEGPSKGRAVTRFLKGMAALQAKAAAAVGETRTERKWLPAAWSTEVDPTDQWADSYWRLPRERASSSGWDTTLTIEWLQLALGSVGCVPQEGGHFSAHSNRKGTATCARAVGVMLEKACSLGGWPQLSSAVQAYIDLTAVPAQAMRRSRPSGHKARGASEDEVNEELETALAIFHAEEGAVRPEV
ncbi:hypothetical protein CYMTET_41942 [Cymbomonas tetramitiformis]|uniref:Integrase n=1 Tax=Cymbomonas tetramitiformis TaxID=36881 RepID=A0AAE0F1H4_9CHLO|nr:hypothetical protein CYMTET_41942 [Cymbomonas tetramitiformis]